MGQTTRDLIRFAQLQCFMLMLITLLCWIIFSWPVAVAYAYGHALVVFAVLLSARFGLRQAASPVASLFWVLTGLMWKWLLIVAGLYAAFARFALPGWPLVFGVIAAHLLAIGSGVWASASLRKRPAQ